MRRSWLNWNFSSLRGWDAILWGVQLSEPCGNVGNTTAPSWLGSLSCHFPEHARSLSLSRLVDAHLMRWRIIIWSHSNHVMLLWCYVARMTPNCNSPRGVVSHQLVLKLVLFRRGSCIIGACVLSIHTNAQRVYYSLTFVSFLFSLNLFVGITLSFASPGSQTK